MPTLSDQDLCSFQSNGYIVREDLISGDDLARFVDLFDTDRESNRYRWHPYGYHQIANYDALVTTPAFDEVVRHPPILTAIEELMGGKTCFGEIGARHMAPYKGDVHRSWHRDRPHREDHPLRMDYIQLMLYLTDVGPDTHCFSISPESIEDDILQEKKAQLARGGIVDIHGPSGTVCLFNVAVLHTATTRSTKAERKTLQIYYGHRDREPLANDSVIPPCFWKHSPDPETRAFYGNLNEVTRTYAAAFGINAGDDS